MGGKGSQLVSTLRSRLRGEGGGREEEEEEEVEEEEEGTAAMYNLMRFSRLPAMDVFLIQFALSARQVICQMCHVV